LLKPERHCQRRLKIRNIPPGASPVTNSGRDPSSVHSEARLVASPYPCERT
jgi:hypothetical protein